MKRHKVKVTIVDLEVEIPHEDYIVNDRDVWLAIKSELFDNPQCEATWTWEDQDE
jgi:hypothetical protein